MNMLSQLINMNENAELMDATITKLGLSDEFFYAYPKTQSTMRPTGVSIVINYWNVPTGLLSPNAQPKRRISVAIMISSPP